MFDLQSDILKRYPLPQKHREGGGKWWPYSWFCLRSPFFKE
uniref:Uncharacterized protein n=1 Tax=Arundo donax TaxID=35708 RepID=A0A0A9B5J8_ARUDO